jgi:transglutaminase-like putative cysteine protease
MINSWRENTWLRVQQHWITALLLCAVIVTCLTAVSNVEPLRDVGTIGLMLIVGVLYGALLATSHLSGRAALIVDFGVSSGLALLIVGRVLPAPVSLLAQSFDKSLWLMNARLLTLLDAVRSDMQWLLTAYLPNTHLFLLINVFAAWNAAVWLSWCVLRRRHALAGVLPLALLIAVYTGLQPGGATLPVLFIAASVLLLARTAYLRETQWWDSRQIGFPDLIGEDWTTWAGILAIFVVLLAGISTPEWRSTVQRFLESLRPPPPRPSIEVPVVLQPQISENFTPSFVPSLGYVGESFPQSDQTVFYITTDDPPSGMESNGYAKPPLQRHYWRGAIFDRYTGTGWEQIDVEVSAPSAAAVPPGRYALQQQFEIIALLDNRLFAAGQPAQASQGVTLSAALNDATAILPRGREPHYEITSWAPRVTDAELAAASNDYPPEILARYLQVPDSLPQRVKDLAARLVRGATSSYDKALRVQEYLRATYPYQLDVPAPPPSRDIVDYFLFDAPGGFCSYYATTMAVLLRSQGVPARVVAGFATGEYDGLQRRYRVPAKAAHAWVEVYFPGYGWIEFEPTPAQDVFDFTTTDKKESDRLPETSPTPSGETVPAPIVIGMISTLLMGLIGLAAYLVWRRTAQLQGAPERQAWNLYWEVRRSLRRLGVEAAPSATPTEFRAVCTDRLAGQPRLLHAVNEVITLYICAVFTAIGPDRSEVQRVWRLWRTAWRERLQLKLKLSARQLRSKTR